MRVIKELVDRIKEELEDAMNYADSYVECKAAGNMMRANQYREMSHDELKHAGYIHAWAVAKVEEVQRVYSPPEEMLEKWKAAHRRYTDEVARVKIMLEA